MACIPPACWHAFLLHVGGRLSLGAYSGPPGVHLFMPHEPARSVTACIAGCSICVGLHSFVQTCVPGVRVPSYSIWAIGCSERWATGMKQDKKRQDSENWMTTTRWQGLEDKDKVQVCLTCIISCGTETDRQIDKKNEKAMSEGGGGPRTGAITEISTGFWGACLTLTLGNLGKLV